jgi:hypothetical protein
MRQYYEPRLVARVIKGEQLPEVRVVSNLNLARPTAKILEIVPSARAGSVDVTVEISQQAIEAGGKEFKSGAADLKLFRDGQLVATYPENGGPIQLDESHSYKNVVLRGIQLEQTRPSSITEFSAYAFNADGVRGSIDRKQYALPPSEIRRKGNAFIIAIGVGSTRDPQFTLRTPPNDAKAFSELFSRSLTATGRFENVRSTQLISSQATKARIYESLAQMGQVRPDDVVLIYFSGMGFTDQGGRFFLVPYDYSSGSPSTTSISADDLASVLLRIDAKDMTVVIDTAFSGTASRSAAFSPNPYPGRSLGELAYNKRIRFLAATQEDELAFESSRLEYSVLMYALQEGLMGGKARRSPISDNSISISELFAYATVRVNELAKGKAGRSQVPTVFDFRDRSSDEDLLLAVPNQ